jgi:L-malate glycosyltransferase
VAAYRPISNLDLTPVRNVQVITSPGVGGREIMAPTLARELQAQGHPTWLACRPETLVARLGHEWGLTVVPTGLHGYFAPRSIVAFSRWLRREKIQVIHAHWSRDLSNLLLAAALAGGVPVILTKHVYATETKRDIYHDWLYRHTAAVIAVSKLVADNLAQTTAAPLSRIFKIYNGLDLREVWNPDLPAVTDLRAAWGVPSGAPIIGYAGRLNQGKGPQVLLEAFRLVAEKYPAWHLVLAGRAVGPQEEAFAAALRAAVERSGLAERIHFPGFHTDMPAVMHTFDLLVCPSEFESFGMVLLEAMAMERAVIGTNAGGIPEIIEPGVNGELFTRGDARDLADKLADLLASPHRRRFCGEAGRRIAREQFNLQNTAAQVAQVFHQVLSERREWRLGRGLLD